MKVRFIMNDKDGEKPEYDKTVSLPAIPEPGETVGIEYDLFGDGTAQIVEVASRRWWIHEEEPFVEVWLSNDQKVLSRNTWVHSGCRYGYEGRMRSVLEHGQ